MVITKIKEQNNNKKRCSIYVDGEYCCSADKDILLEVKLSEGMVLSQNAFNEKMGEINYKSALKAALSMLARSSRTENELVKKLREKDFPETAIQEVVKYLETIGYINDEAYAENLIKSTKDISGSSRKRLYYKLARKGISNEIIKQKLEEAGIDEYDSALRAAAKKASVLKGSVREKRAKLYNFLFRKGFSVEVCSKVLSELKLEEDDE